MVPPLTQLNRQAITRASSDLTERDAAVRVGRLPGPCHLDGRSAPWTSRCRAAPTCLTLRLFEGSRWRTERFSSEPCTLAAVTAVGAVAWIIVDCSDPAMLARFWGEVLGVEVGEALEDPVQYQPLRAATPNGPNLIFQRVPEPKRGKNRLHLDIAVEDIDAAAGRIETLGGQRLPGADFSEDGFRWCVMTDPEGNEFCLIIRPDA